MMMEQMERQIAYKAWIKDIIQNPPSVNGKPVYRINLISTIIQKTTSEDNTYTSLTLDDGTGQIRVKAWQTDIEKIQHFNEGETIIIIGNLKDYNEEIYIIPEIIKKIEPSWEITRKLELIKEYGPPESTPQITQEIKTPENQEQQEESSMQTVTEEKVQETTEETDQQRILTILDRFDSTEGVDLSRLVIESKLDESMVLTIIQELISEGQIFQLGENKYKLM